MADLTKLVEELGKLSVTEAAELVSKLEEAWGVSAAAPVAMAAAPSGAAAAPGEEKTDFDVYIKEAGPKKIEVIKVMRQLTNVGLADAKQMVEAGNTKVLEAASKETANDAKAKLEAAGAVVELK
jgi:large subunit ribosomal protein L7/L12